MRRAAPTAAGCADRAEIRLEFHGLGSASCASAIAPGGGLWNCERFSSLECLWPGGGFPIRPAIPAGRALSGRGFCHRSEEHTSELQSLMRISYAVFCLKKKNTDTHNQTVCTTHN